MLTVSRRVLISAPHRAVRDYLRDLNELAVYEPKIDSLTASPDGTASASGRFFGLPWRGSFRFEFSIDGGYRGMMTEGPLAHMEMTMRLRPVQGGTMLEHAEEYVLPIWMTPLRPLVRRWLNIVLEDELDMIKERAEALNRRLQLLAVEQ